ncbi:MAG: hydrolase 1, exosortase A system-associated [Rubrivivax sp.]
MSSGSPALTDSPGAPAHSIREQALCFDCAGQALLGIISSPAQGEVEAKLGVLIIVGGPQYRAGSHRQFVLLARQLAAAGYISMRFDTRGMGDSAGGVTGFEQSAPDIEAAIDALLKSCPQLEGVVLWGLCDAASAALLYLQARGGDARVAGLVLANPWVRSAQGLARAHLKHYYLQRLVDASFWRKLLSGKVAGAAITGLIKNIGHAMGSRQPGEDTRSAEGTGRPFQQRMASAWAKFNGPILLLLSGRDHTAKEFLEYTGMTQHWQGLLQDERISRVDLPQEDHTFSSAQGRARVEHHTLQWLHGLTPARHE